MNRLRKAFIFFWESPTFTTWGSFFGRAINFLVLLPFILRTFSSEEIAIWYIFATINSLVASIDLGFSPTFIRVISYAYGGATKLQDFRVSQKQDKQATNWPLIMRIYATMKSIYWGLSFLMILLLGAIGTAIIMRYTDLVEKPVYLWISWGWVLLNTCMVLYGQVFSNYLQGLNQIPLLRRWQSIFQFIAALLAIIVIFRGGRLLALTLVFYTNIGICALLRNGLFCFRINRKMNIDSIKPSLDKEILRYIWPSVWRCGIGVLLTNGTIQGSSLVYSVVGDVKQVASYLLSLRIMRTIAQFSQAPFYSKIPRLAALRAQGAVSEQVSQARKGMRWAYWAYVLPFVLLGAFGQKLLLLIESNATLVSQSLWCLLGFALLIERYCGMHAQLYTTTNHILWHITNGITGLLFLLFSCSFFPFVGVYAFPIAIILSHLSFYAWYITKHSYKACSISFRTFDLPVFIPPLLVVICYTMIMFFL